MTDLPDYYFDLAVKATASQQEIEQTYTRRARELRASTVEDAAEELAEVEAAYAVLRDPSRRAEYDAKVRVADAEQDKKDAEMNAYLQSHHHRKTNKGSSGWLDAIFGLLKLFK